MTLRNFFPLLGFTLLRYSLLVTSLLCLVTPATMKFKRLTNLFHLKQLIREPTRITENSRSLIDLFLTSRPELYVSSVIPIGFSDHCAIAGFRKLHRIKLPPPRFVDFRDYKNYDPTLFKTELDYVPWDI